ncbi:hypothetical protein BKI52_17475 [marine bacterium AO1-C]|nr:hypothetical protein BKI52_17475 [marine bacterium AO1-C]
MNQQGYYIKEKILTPTETTEIGQQIEQATHDNPNFRTSNDLFAIHNLLGEIPVLQKILKNPRLTELLANHFPAQNQRCIKAIFFDKPPLSNWVVNWHQDLTINVKEKPASYSSLPSSDNFRQWIQKSSFWSVQPPLDYLQNIVTVRLHLEDCATENGALKILAGSHQPGITAAQKLDQLKENFEEVTCEIPQGGALIMSPLTWHASSKNRGSQHRRVIHLEFSNMSLPQDLNWAECY